MIDSSERALPTLGMPDGRSLTQQTQDKSSPERRHTMMRRSTHRVLKRPDLAAVCTASAAASSVTKYPSE